MTAPDHGDGWAGRVDLLETALRRANQRAQAYSDGLRLADAQLWLWEAAAELGVDLAVVKPYEVMPIDKATDGAIDKTGAGRG